jgi:transposase-like protein
LIEGRLSTASATDELVKLATRLIVEEALEAFTQRDLSEYEISYLFVDGIAGRLRPGAKREPVLAACGFTIEGRRVPLHMMAGSKEDAETVTAFFEDMKRRGLHDPLLVTSDGAPGIIKAIEICFPRAARERCLAAERWRSIKVTEFEHRQIAAVRKELDQEYEAQVGLKTQLSKDAAPPKISSNLRT